MKPSATSTDTTKARYRNSFYRAVTGCDPEFYITDAKPIEYRGHTLYQRIHGRCWDVVRNGVCIGQYVGKSGATGFIDRLLDGGASEWETEKAQAAA